MATLEQTWSAKLASEATITAITGTRIYHGKLPQVFTLPAIVYIRTDCWRERESTGPNGNAKASIMVRNYGETSYAAMLLGEIVRKIMDGWQTKTPIRIKPAVLLRDYDEIDEDTGKPARVHEYSVSHIEELT